MVDGSRAVLTEQELVTKKENQDSWSEREREREREEERLEGREISKCLSS